jgi:hypothetical protein
MPDPERVNRDSPILAEMSRIEGKTGISFPFILLDKRGDYP